MFQIRIHGRGGQGVVTAAELLSVAAFMDGKEAQAFPSFGSERMGAPVVAYCRIDEAPIRLREPVSDPDAIVVQDSTLLHHVAVFEGLRTNGWVLVNSTRDPGALGLEDLFGLVPPEHLVTVPATDLAREQIGRPLPNTCLLGALSALTGAVSIEAVGRAVARRFEGQIGARNVAAARAAYRYVSIQKEVVPDA
ncbi:MAG TPA: 2-oxoacid:acceptor oxidoreductase family protein [Mycobacteriales bacterium]|nr:2-oxoacid:acceptor oxidoreductase family protein [Mycobacteriales bacterium]